MRLLFIFVLLSFVFISEESSAQNPVFVYNSFGDASWNSKAKKIFVNPGKTVAWRIRNGSSSNGSAMDFSDEKGASMIFMNSKGYTGFGTSSPKTKLHFNNESRFSKNIIWDNNVNFVLDPSSNNGDYSFDFQNNDGKAVWHVYESHYGSILSVRNNGRVGIGTKDPEAKLDVEGNAKIGGLISSEKIGIGTNTPSENLEVIGNAKVQGSLLADRVSLNIGSFPDYVFEENYPLRSLADLESFIKENKHLPGIKPENEIVNEGMDVAELNKALVEKVEELTLYTIQQDKRLNELEKKYQKLLELQK